MKRGRCACLLGSATNWRRRWTIEFGVGGRVPNRGGRGSRASRVERRAFCPPSDGRLVDVGPRRGGARRLWRNRRRVVDGGPACGGRVFPQPCFDQVTLSGWTQGWPKSHSEPSWVRTSARLSACVLATRWMCRLRSPVPHSLKSKARDGFGGALWSSSEPYLRGDARQVLRASRRLTTHAF